MAEDGLYAELFTLQARAYVEQPRLALPERPPDEEESPIDQIFFGGP
jgi:hypothetical protein